MTSKNIIIDDSWMSPHDQLCVELSSFVSVEQLNNLSDNELEHLSDIIGFLPSNTRHEECFTPTIRPSDVAILHYSMPNSDAHYYIVGRDPSQFQRMAFGLFKSKTEAYLDFISIAEIIRCDAVIDLSYTPSTISEIVKK
jgi:hypothetical protein